MLTYNSYEENINRNIAVSICENIFKKIFINKMIIICGNISTERVCQIINAELINCGYKNIDIENYLYIFKIDNGICIKLL